MLEQRLAQLGERVALRLSYLAQRLRGKPPAHILHIGKTGGSAIWHAIAPHAGASRYALHLRPHATTLADIPAGEKVVFFLRDPVSRFVSAFYSRQRQGRPRYNYPWTAAEKVAFASFATPNALALALSSADAAERQRATAAMQAIGHVRMHYRDWLGSPDALRARRADILHAGFQESLAADFERLKEQLGLPADLALPTDEVQAHRTPASFDRTLDAAAVANLRQWYADDYAFIELARELGPAPSAAASSR